MSLIKEPLAIRDEYFEVATELIGLINSTNLLKQKKFVIGVCGESGSGKSVTAKCLQVLLEKQSLQSVIIHQDSFYKFPPTDNHNRRKADISWVGPNEVDLENMQRQITLFKSGIETINVPVVDYINNSFSSEDVQIGDMDIMIVEGVYAFELNNLDFHIFLERSYKETLDKRKQRVREVYDPFTEQVLEIEHQIIKAYGRLANAIITKSYKVKAV